MLTLNEILKNNIEEFKVMKRTGELSESGSLYTELFDYYTSNDEMPYGTAKARFGDPFNWIASKLNQINKV